ncbi:SufD family Fe-S cluster assembly protein [Alteriqipengyuania lutimaris]|uniref:SufD family Fe-S cluster assembly protein n=1 Tax=Alteriqipengyuania lutimaris TaxID=1538146 RepID=A0A395LIR1_9SPHN|nr:SufD family Fe-S cluster assembly protein [Alteriqipengyuania lutimaris]MBB3034284.1 Fe-S cluster assembly protein SufD [Alteriqipengyuania lutimaris]RDS76808.1 SufD family Fe-S cluster assembly protein [Alteriqipengyuania lutimaris]
MTDSILLPTRKDEAWRYSDIDAIQDTPPATFEAWEDVHVAAGETWRDFIVIDDADGLQMRRLRIVIEEGARAELAALVAGGQLGRLEVVVTLAEGAHFELGGITLGGHDTTREIVTRMAHEKPGATSNQTVRSVHWGKGTGNFLGRIDVVRDAQKTDAAQSFKGLLLEKGASVNSVPQLEIYADDVQCAHGASVGQLDENARFYMAARGLPPETIRRLLVQAFIGDATRELADEATREALLEKALGKLEERA